MPNTGSQQQVMIIGRASSINVRKVLWTCREIGIAYTFDGDWEENVRAARRAELLALNPNDQFPVLVDGDGPIWESNTICRYLATQRVSQIMQHRWTVERLAAFAEGDIGGNPAGVVIDDHLPDAATMQAIAAEVGYSETAFATPEDDKWRVRYFAPEIEVPFCGHATIALGAALARRHGDGSFRLRLNNARIVVEGRQSEGGYVAALQSPPTHSRPAEPKLVEAGLVLFGYDQQDLDPRIPPTVAEAGARHLILALNDRGRLAVMRYDLAKARVVVTARCRSKWSNVSR